MGNRLLFFLLVTVLAISLAACEDADTAEETVDRDKPPLAFVEPEEFETYVRELPIRGTARAPEATVQYEVVRGIDEVLAAGFLTATCADPCDGEIDETIDLSDELRPGNYTLYLFISNLEDGGRSAEAIIPFFFRLNDVAGPDDEGIPAGGVEEGGLQTPPSAPDQPQGTEGNPVP